MRITRLRTTFWDSASLEGFLDVVGPDAAIPRFKQQLSIVRSLRDRFRSSLFDIRQLAQADLFDSELDAAKELAKNKFARAAGAVAGVVLERHLKEVCGNHGVTIRKRDPQISDLNDVLKGANSYRHSAMAFHTARVTYAICAPTTRNRSRRRIRSKIS